MAVVAKVVILPIPWWGVVIFAAAMAVAVVVVIRMLGQRKV
jgi:hypothetical protein